MSNAKLLKGPGFYILRVQDAFQKEGTVGTYGIIEFEVLSSTAPAFVPGEKVALPVKLLGQNKDPTPFPKDHWEFLKDKVGQNVYCRVTEKQIKNPRSRLDGSSYTAFDFSLTPFSEDFSKELGYQRMVLGFRALDLLGPIPDDVMEHFAKALQGLYESMDKRAQERIDAWKRSL